MRRGVSVERPQVHRAAVFAVVSIALFMWAVDSTIVATGLPTIGHALHARLNWTSWTVSGYQLGLVVAMPIAGRLSDRIGRRRIFLFAAALFTLSSLACGLTNSIWLLIAFRVIQAVGGGAFVPSATGMVADAYHDRRAEAVGFFSSIFPIGAIVGPILGGVIIASWSWRGIFLVNVPIGAVFLLLGFRFLPRAEPLEGRVAPVGAVLLGLTVLGAMLLITHLGDANASLFAPATLLPLVMALTAGALFFWHNARSAIPVIPSLLIRDRSFLAMNLLNFMWGACTMGLVSLIPVFGEGRYSMTPLSAGSLLSAQAVGEIALAAIAAVFIRRTGYRAPMFAGFLMIALGLAVIEVRPVALSPYAWLIAAAGVIGLGTGLSAPAANNATLQLSPDDVGTITGLRGAARQSGAIIAVAVTSSIAARSGAHIVALGWTFFAVAMLFAALTPIVFLVPDRDPEPLRL